MRRSCERCGSDFDCRSSRARFCSDRCRVSAHRSKGAPAADPAVVADLAEASSLVDVVMARVKSATSSPEAQAALILARRIDSGADSLAAVAAATKELTRLLSSVQEPAAAATPSNPLDDLAKRRERRAAV